MLLSRDIQIIALFFDLNAQPLESMRDDAQMLNACIFYSDFALCHGRETNERTDFNHVGQATMFCAAEFFHAFDVQQIGTQAFYFSAHSL